MKNLFKALADFQQEVPVIHKGTQGYGYSFADLPTIFNIINPILKNNGLGFTQLVGNNEIKTIVFHAESGEQIETITAIPQNVQLKGMNDFQILGSAITYVRRYALSAMLGLVTDKDTDAHGESDKKTNSKQNKKTLSDELFARALSAIERGEYTIETLKNNYALTEKQLTEINNIQNS